MLDPLTPTRARTLLSPSPRVMVAAAATDCGESQAATLPWSDVHWPTLLQLSAHERADTQLHRLLRSAPAGGVPEDALAASLARSRVASFRAAELADAAALTCDALAEAGVEVLWLKGAAMAMQSPVGFGVRAMGDLDVLVEPARAPIARAALLAAGWRDGPRAPGYEAHHHAVPMVWRAGLRLELHTGVIPEPNPFARHSTTLWMSRGVPRRWEEREVRVLPPEWHVVHASVHWSWNHEGAVGSWQYLRDMHELASRIPSWGVVAEVAEELGAVRPVGWGLWSAATLADVPIDRQLIADLRGAPRSGVSGLTEREWVLRAFQSHAASPSVRWSRYWWRRAMGGLGDAGGRWPWVAGRDGSVPGPLDLERAPDADSEGDARVSRPGLLTRAASWQRHLARVLSA